MQHHLSPNEQRYRGGNPSRDHLYGDGFIPTPCSQPELTHLKRQTKAATSTRLQQLNLNADIRGVNGCQCVKPTYLGHTFSRVSPRLSAFAPEDRDLNDD